MRDASHGAVLKCWILKHVRGDLEIRECAAIQDCRAHSAARCNCGIVEGIGIASPVRWIGVALNRESSVVELERCKLIELRCLKDKSPSRSTRGRCTAIGEVAE